MEERGAQRRRSLESSTSQPGSRLYSPNSGPVDPGPNTEDPPSLLVPVFTISYVHLPRICVSAARGARTQRPGMDSTGRSVALYGVRQ